MSGPDHDYLFAVRVGRQWRYDCRCGEYFTDPTPAEAAEQLRRHKAQYEPAYPQGVEQ